MCFCWFIIYLITLFNARPTNIIKLIHTVVVVAVMMVVVVVVVITIRKITKYLTLEITLYVA